MYHVTGRPDAINRDCINNLTCRLLTNSVVLSDLDQFCALDVLKANCIILKTQATLRNATAIKADSIIFYFKKTGES